MNCRPREEQEAIDRMLTDAKKFGYGNFIDCLRKAWQKKLMESGFSEETAKRASWDTEPLHKDIDELKRDCDKKDVIIHRLRRKLVEVNKKELKRISRISTLELALRNEKQFFEDTDPSDFFLSFNSNSKKRAEQIERILKGDDR